MIDSSNRPTPAPPIRKEGSLAAIYGDLTKEHRPPLALVAVALLAVNVMDLVPPILLGMLVATSTGFRR